MNGYNLIRDWYNFKFDNPSKVKAIHSDFYCYLIDRWNRLGQKQEFGLPKINLLIEELRSLVRSTPSQREEMVLYSIERQGAISETEIAEVVVDKDVVEGRKDPVRVLKGKEQAA